MSATGSPIVWPELDDRPASHGLTCPKAGIASGAGQNTVPSPDAGFDPTLIANCPPAIPSAIEIYAGTTDASVVFIMANGNRVTMFVPANTVEYRRLAPRQIHTDTVLGTAGTLTLYWNPSSARNAPDAS